LNYTPAVNLGSAQSARFFQAKSGGLSQLIHKVFLQEENLPAKQWCLSVHP
jgi:hypothetical protein